MAQNAPGEHYRTGMSLIDLFEMFPDDKTAEEWFTEQRWPNGVACPMCGSLSVNTGAKHPTMPTTAEIAASSLVSRLGP